MIDNNAYNAHSQNKYVTQNLEVNFHGFARNARVKGYNFDKQLESLLINSFTFKDYVSENCCLKPSFVGKTKLNLESIEFSKDMLSKRSSMKIINLPARKHNTTLTLPKIF